MNIKKIIKWSVIGFGGLIVLFIIIGVASDSSAPKQTSTSSKTTVDTKSLGVGEEGYIKVNFQGLVLATTKETNNELSKALLAKDSLGVADLVASGKAFSVDNGVKILVIDQDYGIRKIRILEGDKFNSTGWIPMEWISRSK